LPSRAGNGTGEAMLSIFDEGPWRPCPEPFNLAAHVLAHVA
jgi:hypothetical protein